MSSAAEILVIILSIFLAFFLILAIILTIYLIILTRQIRKVTKSAESTFNNLGTIVERITNITSPMFMAGIVKKYVKKFKKSKEKEEEG